DHVDYLWDTERRTVVRERRSGAARIRVAPWACALGLPARDTTVATVVSRSSSYPAERRIEAWQEMRMDVHRMMAELPSGMLSRSEHVQIRLRPELKHEIEALKRLCRLSWQTLVEQLLEAWVQAHRQMPEPQLTATTPPQSPAAPDQR